MNKNKLGGMGIYFLVIVLVIAAYFAVRHTNMKNEQYSPQEMTQDIENDNISKVTIGQNAETPTGVLTIELKSGEYTTKVLYVSDVKDMENLFKDKGIIYETNDVTRTSKCRWE